MGNRLAIASDMGALGGSITANWNRLSGPVKSSREKSPIRLSSAIILERKGRPTNWAGGFFPAFRPCRGVEAPAGIFLPRCLAMKSALLAALENECPRHKRRGIEPRASFSPPAAGNGPAAKYIPGPTTPHLSVSCTPRGGRDQGALGYALITVNEDSAPERMILRASATRFDRLRRPHTASARFSGAPGSGNGLGAPS